MWDAEGTGEVGASHGKGVMREGEVPGKGHLLSPGSRKSSQEGHAELATKEEMALDSWRCGGEHCWQRKLGVRTGKWECVGLGSSESCAVARAGHAECGRMQGMRPEKQFCVLWYTPNHATGSWHGSVCPGSLALGPAVPTNGSETLVKSLPFSALELPFLNAEEHITHVILSCHSEPQSFVCVIGVIRGSHRAAVWVK